MPAKQNLSNNQAAASIFFKILAFLRWFIRSLRLAVTQPKNVLLSVFRKIYHNLPISVITRNRLKNWFYSNVPWLFSHTLSYKLWQSQLTEKPATQFIVQPPLSSGEPFNFIEHKSPVVSIIIPVFDNYIYTYRCLRSLWSHASSFSFEVIVIDDCSKDNTAEELPKFGGLRYERNNENLGFVRSCNKGATLARGKLIVFLNNDTVVRRDWLDELVNTFNIVPNAGLTGSKLLYPDGKLQEAGGIIWKDGNGWNYGRQDDSLLPKYNYLREVDYCSGASIMIPKKLFDELKGFDEHYIPAYCEDSDLAFRVRQAGFKVLYQPLSQVIHFEGVTSGTDTSTGTKAYQVENSKKLFKRWQGVLTNHGVPGVNPELEKDRSASGRVLILDHCTPTPDQDAGSVTVVNLMRILQSFGFKVTFIPEDNFLYMEPYTQDLQRLGIECIYAPYSVSVEQHLKQAGQFYDVILFFRVTVGERNISAIEKYCPHAKTIFHTIDLHFIREMREAELIQSTQALENAQNTKRRELDLIRKVDATIVHSSYEKELLEAEFPGQDIANKIFLFGWINDIPGSNAAFNDRKELLFIGGFQHLPNVDAAIYFAKEIFPLIRAKLPDAKCIIVGSRAPKEVIDLSGNGIEVLGYVEDLQPVFDRSKLSVIPLRYGAGIKGKIGTCLSHALPCVSTQIGVEGMGITSDDGVLVGDTPEAFAEAVIRLYQDPILWQNLSTAGLNYVHRNFSLETGKEILKSLLLKINLNAEQIAEQPIPSNFEHLKATKNLVYSPDLEKIHSLYLYYADSKQTSDIYLNSEQFLRQQKIEEKIIDNHKNLDSYELPGYCQVCQEEVNFLVDKKCGAIIKDASWSPNWRERLVCNSCGLNSRQRAIVAEVCATATKNKDRRIEIYLMEQVTPTFHWLDTHLTKSKCTGSEYLGDGIEAGKIIKGLRHEDVEKLSFTDNVFDLIISNDVLEHVNQPLKALTEAYRILRPGGVTLITVPFFLSEDNNIRRAEIQDGKIKHLLPPVYHGNPVSEEGSLVFTDFGWDFIQDIKNAGFKDVSVIFYWSEIYGYLGGTQHYIRAKK